MISTRTSFVVLLLVAAVCVSAGAEVYRYVDEDGNSHFSDSLASIPPRYRDQVADISAELRTQPGVNVIPGLNQGEPRADGGAGAQTAPASAHAAPNSSQALAFEAGAASEQAMGALAGQLWGRFGFLLIAALLLFVVVGFLLSASILLLACKLAAPETPGFGRACAVVFVQGLVGMALNGVTAGLALTLGLYDGASAGSPALSVLSVLVCLMAYSGVLSAMTDLGFSRSVWVTIVHWLLSLLICLVPIALIFLFSGSSL